MYAVCDACPYLRPGSVMPETSQVGHGFPQEERLGPASRDTEEEPEHGLIGERACEVSGGTGMVL